MRKPIFILIILFVANFTFAQIKVVTTTTVIYDIVNQVGGAKVEADYLCRGDQDPHYLEILPSYMLKLRNADIMLKIGLGLELWAQQLIDGSRNSDLKVIDLSEPIEKKEIPTGVIDASRGDVHPSGNPHYWLDPENVKIMAATIRDLLITEDPDNSEFYNSGYNRFVSQLDSKISEWSEKMEKVKNRPFIFFHASWIYFAERFNIKIAGYVEPKPGIPPTPSHNAEIISLIKKNKIKAIVMQNFYSENAPKQIANITGAEVIKVPTAVFGMEGIDNYFEMMDYIVEQISKKG